MRRLTLRDSLGFSSLLVFALGANGVETQYLTANTVPTATSYAAMVADPQHLLEGATGSGETVVMSSTRAIETYRAATPTGAGGLPETSTQSGS